MDTEEKAKALLNLRVKLDNGENGYIFTFSTEKNARGRYTCHVCNSVLCTPISVIQHSIGKNHLKKMEADYHPHEQFTKVLGVNNDDLVKGVGGKLVTAPGVELVDLAPGEPVPPGFEDVVRRVPEISPRLDAMKSALIGLEYLVEITPTQTENEPRYVCLLCDKRGDSRTVLAHFVCFNHRIRYLAKYFPIVYQVLFDLPKTKESRRGTHEMVSRVVNSIESKFGRLVPVIAEGADFDARKKDIFIQIEGGRHFYETPDAKYEALVDLDLVKQICADQSRKLTIDLEVEEAKFNSGFREVTETTVFDDPIKKTVFVKVPNEEIKKVNVKDKKEPPIKRYRRGQSVNSLSSLSSESSYHRSRSRSWSRSPVRKRDFRSPHRSAKPLPFRRTRSRSRSRSRSPGRRRGRSPYRRFSPVRKPFRRSPQRLERRSPYRRSSPPEKHSSSQIRPFVSFKIKSSGVRDKDQEEKREKVKKLKNYISSVTDEIVQKLKAHEKAPEKHPLYSEEWKKFWNKRYKELTAEGKDAAKHDFKPEWIKFWTVRVKELYEDEKSAKVKAFASDLGLPPNAELEEDDDDEIVELTPPDEDRQRSIRKKDDFYDNLWREKDKDPNVVHVLRLLAALENQLMSLGPKVNNLLSQALELEKQKKGSSETLLDTHSNAVLFETAMEKLKGQLYAGVVDRFSVKGTRRAIGGIAEVLSDHSKKKREHSEVAAKEVKPITAHVAEPLLVPGVGAVDKLAIAQQVAAALVLQGRTDLGEDELEQLINAVVGMAQGSSDGSAIEKEEIPKSSFNSSLQAMLSSVVKAHSAKSIVNSSLNLLQNYADPPSVANLKEISEHDLKSLLQNFKDLAREEQQHIIMYLKELEAKDPDSVEKLRQYINYGESVNPDSRRKEVSGRLSPFSQREGGANPSNERKRLIASFDDDEDDYSFEDICKAAKKKIKEESKKNVSGKDLVQQMIKDQEKKAADLKKPMIVTPETNSPPPKLVPSSKPVIDPNDLFNNIKVEPVKETAIRPVAPNRPPPSIAVLSANPVVPIRPPSALVKLAPNPVPPNRTPSALVGLATIDPAPPVVEDVAPTNNWDAYQYENPQDNYGYQEPSHFPNNFQAQSHTSYDNYQAHSWPQQNLYQPAPEVPQYSQPPLSQPYSNNGYSEYPPYSAPDPNSYPPQYGGYY